MVKRKKCPTDVNTFSEAARGCHVEVLDWLQNIYGWPNDAVDRTDIAMGTGKWMHMG